MQQQESQQSLLRHEEIAPRGASSGSLPCFILKMSRIHGKRVCNVRGRPQASSPAEADPDTRRMAWAPHEPSTRIHQASQRCQSHGHTHAQGAAHRRAEPTNRILAPSRAKLGHPESFLCGTVTTLAVLMKAVGCLKVLGGLVLAVWVLSELSWPVAADSRGCLPFRGTGSFLSSQAAAAGGMSRATRSIEDYVTHDENQDCSSSANDDALDADEWRDIRVQFNRAMALLQSNAHQPSAKEAAKELSCWLM
jgi:hypothetical protein